MRIAGAVRKLLQLAENGDIGVGAQQLLQLGQGGDTMLRRNRSSRSAEKTVGRIML
jgi:hypothetical protein